MWPPSTKTVTRRSEVSMLCARRFRYALSGIFEYYAPPVSTLGAPGRAAVLGIESAARVDGPRAEQHADRFALGAGSRRRRHSPRGWRADISRVRAPHAGG